MTDLTPKQQARVEAALDGFGAMTLHPYQEMLLRLTAADKQLRALIKKWGERAELISYRIESETIIDCLDELSEYVLPEETSE